MATLTPLTPVARAPRPKKPVNESISTWRFGDRIAFVACWAAGLLLCLIAAAITTFMLVKGIQELNFKLITTHPQSGLKQSETGGFLDPIFTKHALTGS